MSSVVFCARGLPSFSEGRGYDKRPIIDATSVYLSAPCDIIIASGFCQPCLSAFDCDMFIADSKNRRR